MVITLVPGGPSGSPRGTQKVKVRKCAFSPPLVVYARVNSPFTSYFKLLYRRDSLGEVGDSNIKKMGMLVDNFEIDP